MSRSADLDARYEENRIRVKRLLDGSGRPEHLQNLFLSLPEDLLYQFPSMRDLRDFAAHSRERNQGHTHTYVNDLLVSFARHLWADGGGRKHGVFLPEFGKEALLANLRMIGRLSDTEKVLNMRLVQAEGMLRNVLRKMKPEADGSFKFPGNLSKKEEALFRRLGSVYVTSGVYEQGRLTADFEAILRKAKLVDDNQAATISDFSDRLAIFMIMLMHRVPVKNTRFGKASLRAGEIPNYEETGDRRLGVNVFLRMTLEGVVHLQTPVTTVAGVLNTRLRLEDWLSTSDGRTAQNIDLHDRYTSADLTVPDGGLHWISTDADAATPTGRLLDIQSPLELGEDWKLRPMA